MKYSKRREAKIRKRKNKTAIDLLWLAKVDAFKARQNKRKLQLVKSALTAAVGAMNIAIIQSKIGMTKLEKSIAIAEQTIHTAQQISKIYE